MISISGVMSAWTQRARREEPWCSMPRDDQTGELRRVLEELLDPYGGPHCSARLRRIQTVSARHGAFRGAQRSVHGVIICDFAILGSALSHVLASCGVTDAVAGRFLVSLMPAWRVASNAAALAHVEMRGVAHDR